MSTPNPPTRDEQLLSAYLDGELTADEMRAVEARLEQDADARALVEDLRSVTRAVQSLPRHELPADWSQRLAERLDQATQAGSRSASPAGGDPSPRVSFGRSSRGWWWSAAAIAAALMIAVVWKDQDADEVAREPLARRAPIGGEIAARDEPVDREDEALADAPRELSDLDRGLAERAAPPSPAPPFPAPPSPEVAGELAAPATESMRESLALEAAQSEMRSDASPLGSAGETMNRGNATPGQYLIVWADVPDQSLQRQEINNLLVSNGIAVEPRSEAWEDVAEPVRRQIAIRNLEQAPATDGQIRGGGFGGGMGGGIAGGRFSVPEDESARAAGREVRSSTSTPNALSSGAAAELPAAASAAQDGAAERGNDSTLDKQRNEQPAQPVEGEAILVEASAEQIAACLADMERDADNFHTVTIEPVSQLEDLNEKQDHLARPHSFELQQGAENAPASGVTDGLSTREFSEQDAPAALQEEHVDSDVQQGQSLLSVGDQGRARRLKRPDQWYFYNTPPPPDGSNYRLRDKVAAKAAPAVQPPPDIEQQQQLVRLNSAIQFAPNGRTAGDPVLNAAAANQRLQVLFVLRNTDFPAVAAPAAPAEAAEAAGETAP